MTTALGTGGDVAASARAIGFPRLHLRACESTNTLAKELAATGAPHGATITATEQTAGRGRQGRSWVAPAGEALLMSVILRPYELSLRFCPLAAALAVAETCEELAPVACQIKWPNDVWIEGRKVAGILVEARPDEHAPERSWAVIGIGLNTAVKIDDMPPELRLTAATLGLPSAGAALRPLLRRLQHWTTAPADAVRDTWRTRDALQGRRVEWAGGGGHAAGIDDDGNLLVRLSDDTFTTLGAGEVHLSVE